MSVKSIIPTTVNPDLQKERDAASFNVEEFATWFHGGVEKLKFKRDIEQFMFKDKSTDNTLLHYESHEGIYDIALKDAIETAQKLRKLQQLRNPGGSEIWPNLYVHPLLWGCLPAGNPFGVQYYMMVKALEIQATDEQFAKFGKRAANFEICGTYAQTELGHGTFLRGLETRADFDSQTDEFVLNSPTITSYKWWPGGLGHSSNYCVLVAQLYIDNQRKGIEMFFVQLRDEETHIPLPGIDIGDIGKKMGFYGVNNGFLGFKNVRIPRTQMLMRNSQVLRDGTFIKSSASVLIYFTMVYSRCFVTHNNANMLSSSATIATRYAAVRRQSPINANEPEPQIMDHVTQQYKLFPEIASAIAYHLAADYLWVSYEQTMKEMGSGEYTRLPEIHALTCVLKAICTADSAEGIERLRLACGGHGYLSSSYFDVFYIAATAACTYEGDNTVLLLQVGRFLMKSWQHALAGDPLASTAQYLAEVAEGTPFGKWTGTLENILKAIQFVAANKTRLAFENLAQRLQQGQTEAEAANNTGIELIQAAQLHGRSFVAATFLERVCRIDVQQRSTALQQVLENLLEIYLLHIALKHMNDILRFINLTEADLRSLQARLEQALKHLRPNAVAVCDGFDHRDLALSSTLGSYDGNVYERIFEAAKRSPLNKEPVLQSFHTIIKPFLKSNM